MIRAERPLEVERAAGRHPDQEEGDGDDDEQRRDGGQKPPQHVEQHVGLLLSLNAAAPRLTREAALGPGSVLADETRRVDGP